MHTTSDDSFFVAESIPGESAIFTQPEIIQDREGGFTMILRAARHGRVFVLKTLKPEYSASPFHQSILRKEFEIAAGLSHPGIATVFSFEQVKGYGPCITEEWVDGLHLDEYVATIHPTRKRILDILLKLADAVAYLHSKQIVHRDLKPSNIIMPISGDTPKIIDFGVADSPGITIVKGPGGTDGFAAPEQYRHTSPADHRVDIFAFGHILTSIGRFPATAKVCSHPDPTRRPQTMNDVRELLISEFRRPVRIIAMASTATILMAAITAIAEWPVAPTLDDNTNENTVDVVVATPQLDTIGTQKTTASSVPKQPSPAFIEPVGHTNDHEEPTTSIYTTDSKSYIERMTNLAMTTAASRFADHIASADTAQPGIGYRHYYIGYWRHLAKEDMRRWIEENPLPGQDAEEAAALCCSLIDKYSDAHKKEHIAGLNRIENRIGQEYVVIDQYIADEKEDGTLVIYYLGEDDIWHWKEVSQQR